MQAFPLLSSPYAKALESIREEARERRLRRIDDDDPSARIPDDEDDDGERGDPEDEPTRPLRLDRLRL